MKISLFMEWMLHLVGLGFNSQSCSILALHGLHMQLISQYLFPAELKDSAAVSSSSLNSENPYATIKDLPGLPLPFCPPESSYMEMKSAVPRERAYTEITPPPLFHTATLRRGKQHFWPQASPRSVLHFITTFLVIVIVKRPIFPSYKHQWVCLCFWMNQSIWIQLL